MWQAGSTMNLKEGTRRFALLLGGLGAVAGVIGSYSYLQPVMRQQEMHKAFERLANSDVVKEQRKILQAPDPYAGIAKPIYQIDPKTGERVQPGDQDPDVVKQDVPQHGRAKLSDIQPHTGNPWDRPGAPIQSNQADWGNAQPIFSQVNQGGITTINWGHDYEVASIETVDGDTLSPTPAPAAWEYLLVVLFPVAGFVIPWGVVRAIGWVGAGFVASAK